MILINHQDIVVVHSQDSEWKRIVDKITNELFWSNDFITFRYIKDKDKWVKITKRKYPKYIDKCYLEIEYQNMLRLQKLERIIEND